MAKAPKFYTYLWLREDGTPYYVGKGSGRRGLRSYGHRANCPSEAERIIVQEYLNEVEAFTAEKILIAYYGRKDLGTGCLINLTDGGEGPSGQIISLEVRAISSKRLKDNPFPPHSTELRERIRVKLTGRKMSPEFCAKNRARMISNNPFKGRTHSEETKCKLREISKLRAQKPEYLALLRNAAKKGAAARWKMA